MVALVELVSDDLDACVLLVVLDPGVFSDAARAEQDPLALLVRETGRRRDEHVFLAVERAVEKPPGQRLVLSVQRPRARAELRR